MENLKNVVMETQIIEESIEKQNKMVQELKEKNEENIKKVLVKLESFIDVIYKELKPLLKTTTIHARIKTSEDPIDIIFSDNGWKLQPTSRYVMAVSKANEKVQWQSAQYYAENAHYIFKTLEDEVVSSIQKVRTSKQNAASIELERASKTAEELNKSLTGV